MLGQVHSETKWDKWIKHSPSLLFLPLLSAQPHTRTHKNNVWSECWHYGSSMNNSQQGSSSWISWPLTKEVLQVYVKVSNREKYMYQMITIPPKLKSPHKPTKEYSWTPRTTEWITSWITKVHFNAKREKLCKHLKLGKSCPFNQLSF